MTKLTSRQVELVRTSFGSFSADRYRLATCFYSAMFEAIPGIRELFPDDIRPQHRLLLEALALAVESADDLDSIEFALRDLGARHVTYGATEEVYPVVRDTMIASLDTFSGNLWNPELEAAWTALLNEIMERMGAGAREIQRNNDAA